MKPVVKWHDLLYRFPSLRQTKPQVIYVRLKDGLAAAIAETGGPNGLDTPITRYVRHDPIK
jgi:hypothetical protein